MSEQDLAAEIRDIEARLEALKQQQGIDHTDPAGSTSEGHSPSDRESEVLVEELSALETLFAEFDAEQLLDSLSTHASSMLATLNDDLRQTRPSTLLTVFGLGVIVGRLTK